ncbi:ethanolamine ammonia-lyase [Mucilaginibacter hurinus]|uniref:Ethanolamine ammonia-lyase small subunit n=1 Tax=Mucilaginibacter hurinus TaxID=2201324 RepID=A0A367GRI1_9SPHI|nr:ethanolamine ammonia-lyase subunit EutC [Mucilaginibacter hurinus]RCH55870.1 ethanolamine ammonia-lyase [Mucilaginibacter hurinus]
MSEKGVQHGNPWQALQQYTNARIGIGRTGTSITMHQLLQFRLAHAHARDAVYSKLDVDGLLAGLSQFNLPVIVLHSKAEYREQYLKMPGLGRDLDTPSAELLRAYAPGADIVIIIADGLSAAAVNENAVNLLEHLMPMLVNDDFVLAPVCVVRQARVAISDDIGAALRAKISLILIGERPGLSAADSMGAYLTYGPREGLTDEARNCVSNIRQHGLAHKQAAEKLFYLVKQALNKKLSGVLLKDNDEHGYVP